MRVIVGFVRGLLGQRAPVFAWVVVLVVVNGLLPLAFLDRGPAVAMAVGFVVGVALMVALYARFGFSRILGAAHVAWIVPVGWLAVEATRLPFDDAWSGWVMAALATGAVSLALDARDVALWLQGDRGAVSAGGS